MLVNQIEKLRHQYAVPTVTLGISSFRGFLCFSRLILSRQTKLATKSKFGYRTVFPDKSLAALSLPVALEDRENIDRGFQRFRPWGPVLRQRVKLDTRPFAFLGIPFQFRPIFSKPPNTDGKALDDTSMTNLDSIHLFTDGGCSGNPGPGGWAYILRHVASGKEKEAFGAERHTTNNQMELMAVICGLEALKRPCNIELFTDSVYVGQGITQWMAKWKVNGWRRRDGKKWAPVKNEEFWRRLDAALEIHTVKYTRVAGHSGHPENDRCDELAVQAYKDAFGL